MGIFRKHDNFKPPAPPVDAPAEKAAANRDILKLQAYLTRPLA
jgi:hypothetical protein